jgi:GT2 family glycosyltransferase
MTLKIGLGIITCNREDSLIQCLDSIPIDRIDVPCVINDGERLSLDITDKYRRFFIQEHVVNLGVGKSKNNALRYLMSMGCDYMFLMEDDLVILDKDIFSKYIDAYKETGIHHFNYGPGTPFNRKQKDKFFDIHNRHLLDEETDPCPRQIIDYGNGVKISLYTHIAGMFSFFTRECLETVGLMDEDYYNAWEHVDHTYRIIKEKYHPPFWYFADIYNSHEYLGEIKGAIKNSTIAKDSEEWQLNVRRQGELYKEKHGHYPNELAAPGLDEVKTILKSIKNER